MRMNALGWYVPDHLLPDEPDPVASQHGECLAQIALATQHIKRNGLAIQAGGRVGLWPRLLAPYFEKVITLEPDSDNFECLQGNVVHTPNVVPLEAALGRRKRYAHLMTSPLSTGEHYIAEAGERGNKSQRRVAMVSIDELAGEEGERVDAIFLDIEGYEIEALAGAVETLRSDKPTLVLEENSLCRRYGYDRGDLEGWLAPFGYNLVDGFTTLPPEIQNDGHWRGADLIFV